MPARKAKPKQRPRQARDPYANLTLVVNDVALNDSDKTFVVPAGEEWEIQSTYVELITTVTAGNRVPTVRLLDGSNNFIAASNAGTQAASLTGRFTFAPNTAFGTGSAQAHGQVYPLPPVILPAGFKVQVLDAAAIDAAADDLTVRIFAQVTRR